MVSLSTSQRPKSVADIHVVISQKDTNKEGTLSRAEKRSQSDERKTVTPKQSPIILVGDGLERSLPTAGKNLKSNTSLMSGEEAVSGKMGYVRYSTKRSK